jgi:predicted O-linked N-acetylglucosamine transferase (SPINDLY family)
LKIVIFSKHQNNSVNDFRDRNTYWHSFLDTLQQYVQPVENRGNMLTYSEQSFEYSKIPAGLSNYVLQGYFQSYKYFHHNYAKITDMINLKEKQRNIQNKYNHLCIKKQIAMHFRLEDYVIWTECHRIQQPEYYIEALERLCNDLKSRNEDIKNYEILCFYARYNRDEEIVKQYLQIIKNNVDAELNFKMIPDDIEDWEQMLVMSLCDHFIIGNSSFSWFGAYFSDNADKLVYYPSVWFGPKLAHNNTNDLCPIEWIKV